MLRGCLRFDLEWLVAARHIRLTGYLRPPELDTTIQTLTQEATDLGYVDWGAARATTWVLPRLYLHTGKSEVGSFGESDIEALKGALRSLGSRSDLQALYGSRESYHTALKTHLSQIYQASVSLYHRGQFAVLPQKNITRRDEHPVLRPLMEAVADRYAKERSKDCRPSTAKGHGRELKAFVVWVAAVHPEVESFAEVDREMVLEYAEAMKEMILPRTGQPAAPSTRAHRLQTLSVFFRDTADWGWEDVPGIPLLSSGDYPKEVDRVPRYIPEDELAKVTEAIRELECPYQRTALLIARWSGARRDEIRRLELDCLDTYRDGTPRLRIPAGKTDRERFVPLNEEAARAVRELQEITRPGRGFVDPVTGYHVRYLFNSFGKPMSVSYLFDSSLMKVCAQVGLQAPGGRHEVTAHRFRHTLGTQLAERGAKLHTIMSILGHESPQMSMVYARISDETVRKDYESVLGPGAVIAGPSAEALRSGELPDSTVDWLKTNFFKTELELGHCLRLPQEGPCECETYLTCAKFVTTKEYAPRLRARREQEFELIEDAACRGWEREVERHRRTVSRVEQLLAELEEPLD